MFRGFFSFFWQPRSDRLAQLVSYLFKLLCIPKRCGSRPWIGEGSRLNSKFINPFSDLHVKSVFLMLE